MNKKIKENIVLILIIILFLSLHLLYLNPDADLWWDSSVYIGIGKHIYSFGEAGLYEDSRPLSWPLVLGLLWKLGLDVIFLGKLLVLAFGVGIIMLTYLTANELFNKKTAFISSLLLAFSPTFFLFNSILFTEIPSTFFALLGFYLFIKKKYDISGLFFGIAFMIRFFQILTIAPVYLFFIYLVYRRKAAIKKFFTSLLFFSFPVILYLISNALLYNNPIHPFLLQAWMTKFTGWVFNQPFNFYFVNLVKENILVLFSVIGLFFIFRNENSKKFIMLFVFLLAFLPYNFVPHKEMRFLISVFPFLYIITGYGIVKFSEISRRYHNPVLLAILLIGIFHVIPQLRLNGYDDKLDAFYDFMENNDITDGLWISNPSFIVYGDSKAEELIYYPLYNTDKINELQENIGNAKYILINTCDILPCPQYDGLCMERHEGFLELLKEEFDLYYNEISGNCERYIFTLV